VGFQLSFLTSLGLILFSRPLAAALLAILRVRLPVETAKRVTRALAATLIVTVAAQAAVLPLILFYFGRLSPVSLLANLLVLPVQPAILAGGIAALFGGLAWEPVGQALATVPWLFLTYTWQVIKATAALPFASVDVGRVGPGFVAGYYLLLSAAYRLPRILALSRGSPDLRRAGALSALFVVPVCLGLFAWRDQPDGRLRVAYVPAGKGEAAVVVAPNGRTAWLWDGRGDGAALVAATRRGGWVRRRPDVTLAPCGGDPWPAGSCVDPSSLAPGTIVALQVGLELTRLDAGPDAAFLLTYGKFRAVLPGALSQEGQRALAQPLGLSALKAAGPDTGAWPVVEFLAAAQPQLTLWPLETTYPPAVSEYMEEKMTTARVEPDAVVEVISDGERLWVFRRSPDGPR
jgi:hypothetical protein